jgi:hypothetical protein
VNYTLSVAVLLVLYAGCGGTRAMPQPAPASPPPAQPTSTVTGTERVAWDQELLPDTSAEGYEFAVYVNGERTALEAVTCETAAEANQSICSAALPPLRAGVNRLEFVAVLDGTESARSEPLDVRFGAAATRSNAIAPAALPGVRVEDLAADLDRPTDLTMLPDGRLLIAERRGRVRVVAGGATASASALTLEDVAADPGSGLLAIAAHPDFADNRFVYLAYTTRQRDGGAASRVIRAREVNNTLGEIAVIHQWIDVEPPSSISVRFGPDGKLYLGIAACRECGSTSKGTVLRLNDDGSAPRDSAAGSPVYMSEVAPVGLSWHGDQLWIGDRRAEATAVVVAAPGAVQTVGTTEAGAVVFKTDGDTPLVLPTLPRGGGLHWYRHRRDGMIEPVALLDDRTMVHAALYAIDGAIYVCASAESEAAARLIRVTGWQ